MHEQPDFYFEVIVDDQNIGTARMLSKYDLGIINRKCGMKLRLDDDGNPKTVKVKDKEYPDMEWDNQAMIDWKILLSFGGVDGGINYRVGEEHWNLTDKDGKIAQVNIRNIRFLDPNLKARIFTKITKKQAEWENNGEAIAKN